MDFDKKKCSLIVKLSGDIDHHSSKDIKNATEREFENTKSKNLIFDFSAVDFMDSAGVGLILGRYKAVTKSGGKIAIVGSCGTIDRIFDISGIYKLMNRYETLNEALKAVE